MKSSKSVPLYIPSPYDDITVPYCMVKYMVDGVVVVGCT